MLKIGKPYLECKNGKARLCADLQFPNKECTAWFEAEEEYAKYMTVERGDAFVLAFLTAAMKAGEDIVSEAPVTQKLLTGINERLIPTLSTHMKRYHRMQIQAEGTDDAEASEKAVGLGWTGGVDCFYSFKKSMEGEQEPKVTHLVVANIGTFEEEDNEAALRIFTERAWEMAKAHGIRAMWIHSNIQDIVEENYLSVGAFRMAAAISAFQKLFSIFLHSAGAPNDLFVWDETATCLYESFLFECLSTEQLAFCTYGAEVSRREKIAALRNYPPAWTRLHPCIHVDKQNCGVCGKCMRTFTNLYALGDLEKFAAVIDTKQFEKNIGNAVQYILTHTEHFDNWELLQLLDEKGMITPRQKRLVRVLQAAKNGRR